MDDATCASMISYVVGFRDDVSFPRRGDHDDLALIMILTTAVRLSTSCNGYGLERLKALVCVTHKCSQLYRDAGRLPSNPATDASPSRPFSVSSIVDDAQRTTTIDSVKRCDSMESHGIFRSQHLRSVERTALPFLEPRRESYAASFALHERASDANRRRHCCSGRFIARL